MPQSLGALGGKPNNAYYFIGFLGKKTGITSKSSWARGGWAEGLLGRPGNSCEGDFVQPGDVLDSGQLPLSQTCSVESNTSVCLMDSGFSSNASTSLPLDKVAPRCFPTGPPQSHSIASALLSPATPLALLILIVLKFKHSG